MSEEDFDLFSFLYLNYLQNPTNHQTNKFFAVLTLYYELRLTFSKKSINKHKMFCFIELNS